MKKTTEKKAAGTPRGRKRAAAGRPDDAPAGSRGHALLQGADGKGYAPTRFDAGIEISFAGDRDGGTAAMCAIVRAGRARRFVRCLTRGVPFDAAVARGLVAALAEAKAGRLIHVRTDEPVAASLLRCLDSPDPEWNDVARGARRRLASFAKGRTIRATFIEEEFWGTEPPDYYRPVAGGRGVWAYVEEPAAAGEGEPDGGAGPRTPLPRRLPEPHYVIESRGLAEKALAEALATKPASKRA
jgi:hypothetical protein